MENETGIRGRDFFFSKWIVMDTKFIFGEFCICPKGEVYLLGDFKEHKHFMAINKRIMLAGLAGLVFFLGGCAKPPTEEMNNAAAAVTRAENDADAVTYAGNTLIRARDTLTRMKIEAEAKRYDAARALASEVISAADKAVADGRAGAERARAEAAALVSGLRTSLTETETALNAARQVKNIKLDFDALSRELAGVGGIVEEAERAQLAGNYQNAREKAQGVRSALGNINIQISNATRAASRKQ
jgi:hypothetical protein